jgi:peptide-methionine (S)-S-oxide reductase
MQRKWIGTIAAMTAGAAAIAGCNLVQVDFLPKGASGEESTADKVGINPGNVLKTSRPVAGKGLELISLSAGCFWGVETQFREIPGVVATAVGYTGGTVKNPTYEQVCTARTGHTESVLVEFDPAKVSLKKILDVYWAWHNPTVVDRQGPDVGPQYRTAIWTYSDAQKPIIATSLAAEQKKWKKPIVTTVKPAEPFWAAEEYHQQYDAKTGHRCRPPREYPDF